MQVVTTSMRFFKWHQKTRAPRPDISQYSLQYDHLYTGVMSTYVEGNAEVRKQDASRGVCAFVKVIKRGYGCAVQAVERGYVCVPVIFTPISSR